MGRGDAEKNGESSQGIQITATVRNATWPSLPCIETRCTELEAEPEHRSREPHSRTTSSLEHTKLIVCDKPD